MGNNKLPTLGTWLLLMHLAAWCTRPGLCHNVCCVLQDLVQEKSVFNLFIWFLSFDSSGNISCNVVSLLHLILWMALWKSPRKLVGIQLLTAVIKKNESAVIYITWQSDFCSKNIKACNQPQYDHYNYCSQLLCSCWLLIVMVKQISF